MANILMSFLSPFRPFGREVIFRYRDVKEKFLRYFPGNHLGLPKFSLSATQVYPEGTNLDKVLTLAMKDFFDQKKFKIKRETPVASIGSCFAEEFAFYMLRRKFNYLSLETSLFKESANWGRVYTIKNFLRS